MYFMISSVFVAIAGRPSLLPSLLIVILYASINNIFYISWPFAWHFYSVIIPWLLLRSQHTFTHFQCDPVRLFLDNAHLGSNITNTFSSFIHNQHTNREQLIIWLSLINANIEQKLTSPYYMPCVCYWLFFWIFCRCYCCCCRHRAT